MTGDQGAWADANSSLLEIRYVPLSNVFGGTECQAPEGINRRHKDEKGRVLPTASVNFAE
jgi:hypothetical protein